MTAMLCARFKEKGRLSFDDSITKYFKTTNSLWYDVTIRHLMCHESGLDQTINSKAVWSYMWRETNRKNQRPIRKHVCETLLNTVDPSKGKNTYMYSNSNFIILGAILEMVSGQSWEELMRTELFQSNNMKRCGFGNPARVERDGLTGHVRKASKENIKIKMGPGDDNPSSLGPAGTVHAPLESWFKFVMSCLPNSNYVSSQTLKDLHRPIRSKSTYAGGWAFCNRSWADGTAMSHDGSNTMNYSIVWMSPKKRAGVLIATNISYDGLNLDLDKVVAFMIRKHI
eukprot:g4882.t1